MPLHSISISGLITLDLHALNNEGSEGNQLQTRQVQIVDDRGQLHAVNAISGDMFKHIQAHYLHQLSVEAGLPLCGGCKIFDANRINYDDAFANNLAASQEFADATKNGKGDSYILGQVLSTCVMDDLEGILITKKIGDKSRSIPRKSVVEFGWVVGRPDVTRTDAFLHTKYVPEGRGKGSGGQEGANLGQNLFHRPASSGQYAVVVHADLYRIGRNDITLDPVLTPDAIAQRSGALLRSLLATFLRPLGAQRNTQNPHVVNFEGIVATSASTLPAPTISALNSQYREQLREQREALNLLANNGLALHEFDSLGQFSSVMANLTTTVEKG